MWGRSTIYIMKQYALFSAFKKLFGPRGKGIGKRLVFPNLIRGMELTGPNQLWSTDITYIKLKKEFVYLSAIMDVYTRKIVGWSVSRSMTHEFCLRSLEVAMKKQNPPPGVIHHSDRGTQYTCEQYVSFLEKHNFKISMSRVKTPEDNAFIESFFKSLKREEVFARNYESFEDVIKQLPRFIDQIYNTTRLHSSIGYQTPTEWETEVIKIKPAKRPVQKIWGWAVWFQGRIPNPTDLQQTCPT